MDQSTFDEVMERKVARRFAIGHLRVKHPEYEQAAALLLAEKHALWAMCDHVAPNGTSLLIRRRTKAPGKPRILCSLCEGKPKA